jgi:ubiquinol-cytochrome c reductase cytochrome b subunit
MWLILSRLGAAYYFLHFLVVLPFVGKYEQPRALPTSISQPILQTKHVSA